MSAIRDATSRQKPRAADENQRVTASRATEHNSERAKQEAHRHYERTPELESVNNRRFRLALLCLTVVELSVP